MIKIIEDINMVDQFRLPRSKKKRIRKKFFKNKDNFRPSTRVFFLEQTGSIICHPVMARFVRARMEEIKENAILGVGYPDDEQQRERFRSLH